MNEVMTMNEVLRWIPMNGRKMGHRLKDISSFKRQRTNQFSESRLHRNHIEVGWSFPTFLRAKRTACKTRIRYCKDSIPTLQVGGQLSRRLGIVAKLWCRGPWINVSSRRDSIMRFSARRVEVGRMVGTAMRSMVGMADAKMAVTVVTAMAPEAVLVKAEDMVADMAVNSLATKILGSRLSIDLLLLTTSRLTSHPLGPSILSSI